MAAEKKYILFALLLLMYVSATFPMGVAFVGISLFKPLLVLLTIITIVNINKYQIGNPLLWICIYLLVILAITILPNGEIRNSVLIRIVYNISPLLLSYILIMYFNQTKNEKRIPIFLLIAFSIVIIRLVTAIKAEIMIPNIARNSATGMYEDIPEFDLIGAGSYQFINGLIFMVLPIIYVLRSSAVIRKKIIYSIVALLSLVSIIYTGWTTALIMFAILVGIGLSPRKTKYVLLYMFLLFIILFITVYSDIDLQLLEKIYESNNTIYDKIVDIKIAMNENEAGGQLLTRQTLYLQSVDVFGANPLLGDVYAENGAHSFWLDHLANFGIIGTIPLLIAYISVIVTSLKNVPDGYRRYHFINAIIFVIFGCVKNIAGYEFMLFLCVLGPLMLNKNGGGKRQNKSAHGIQKVFKYNTSSAEYVSTKWFE
jgi:hypothetical protein